MVHATGAKAPAPMKRVLLGAILSLATLAVGCGGEQRGTAAHDGGQAGGGAEPTACSSGSGCTGCDSCFSECLCSENDAALCAERCSSVGTDSGGPVEPNEPPVMEPPDAGAIDAGNPTNPPQAPSPDLLARTLVVDTFDIPPGEEYFRCQNYANPFGADAVIVKTESFMTAGSHHLFVFQGGFSPSPLESCGGLEFNPYLHLAQRPQQLMQFPEGVGKFFAAGEGIRIQAHYFNTTEETIHAEIAVTLHASPPEAVPNLASHLFINTLSISVQPYSAGTANKSCGVPHDVSLVTASSHMHQHGVYFVARSTGGQLIYETNEWAEPEPWMFEPPRPLAGGETVNIECQYENDTPFPLSFGESANTSEMCILAATYYPAPAGESITCLF